MSTVFEIIPISASELEIQDARTLLSQFYDEKSVEEKIQKCLSGWRNSPKTFPERISLVTGRARKDKKTGQLVIKKEVSSSLNGPEGLNEDEQGLWRERYKTYNKEFDFNNSSDRIILEQILADEILITRLRKKLLTNIGTISSSDSDLLDEIIARHRESLNKLGILRVQRDLARGDIDGSVADLTIVVDEKVSKMHKLDAPDLRSIIRDTLSNYSGITEQEVIDLIDEIYGNRLNQMRGDLNPVPQEMMERIKSGKMEIVGELDA